MPDSYGQGDNADGDSSSGGTPPPPPPPGGSEGQGYPPPSQGGYGYPPPQGGYPPPPGQGGYGGYPGAPGQQSGYPSGEGQQSGYPPVPGQSPYGQGYAGSGYPGGAWDTERRRGWSGLAIAAFVVGLLVPCIGLLIAVPLGIVALVQIRKTGDKGKAFAILGIVLPILWLAGFGAVIAWFVSTTAERDEAGVIVEAGRLDVGDIREGDCLDVDGLDASGEVGAFDIDGVPCADAHNAEVAAIASLSGGEDYPGEFEIRRQAGRLCAREQPSLPTGLLVYPLYPTESLWDDDGGRRAICLAVREDYSSMTGQQLD